MGRNGSSGRRSPSQTEASQRSTVLRSILVARIAGPRVASIAIDESNNDRHVNRHIQITYIKQVS